MLLIWENLVKQWKQSDLGSGDDLTEYPKPKPLKVDK